MSYTKIYYDDIWEAASKGSKKCKKWIENFETLSKSITDFVDSDSFTGQAAANTKNYLKQVHGLLIAILNAIIESYSALAIDYYDGYRNIVDKGDRGEFGLRYTTIVSSEVSDSGTVQRKLNDVLKIADQVSCDAICVKNSISDLVSIAAYPKINNLFERFNAVKANAQTVHDNAVAYEASRMNDFEEIDSLISQALGIINALLGKARTPVIAYQSGYIGAICDFNQIGVNINALSDKIKTITSKDSFQSAADIVLNRDEYLKEEEKASREWTRWILVGFAVVGSVALAVVAAPAACVVIGAVSGGLSAAATCVVENYIETGSLFEGMNWSDFGKDVLIGAVGGAVGGYLSSLSTGSVIKQPIKNGLTVLKHTVIREAAEGAAAIYWETGETIVDVGIAIIDRKPGDEILSVLGDGVNEIGSEYVKMCKETLSNGAETFVSATVGGYFNVDTSDKSVLRKIGEKAVQDMAGDAAKGAVNTIWNVGEAVLDNDKKTTVFSALKEGARETVSDMAGSGASAIVSGGGAKIVNKIDNNAGKVVMKTVIDTGSKTSERVVSGVTNRLVDYLDGDEKDVNKVFGDIWKTDLQGGKTIVQDVGVSAGKNITDTVLKEQKFNDELRKLDGNRDGKIELVQFGDVTVSKQDFDAATENAGKGIYKDKTVQDILGLPKDTDISTGKERVVSMDRVEQYSSNRKTTDTVTVNNKYIFTKNFYTSSINAAGKGEYSEKSANEILGLPDDVDLQGGNVEFSRVANSKIGQDKKVELYEDYSKLTSKYHISSMNRKTKQARDKIKK